jgi:hypothetical protein
VVSGKFFGFAGMNLISRTILDNGRMAQLRVFRFGVIFKSGLSLLIRIIKRHDLGIFYLPPYNPKVYILNRPLIFLEIF